MIKAATFIVTGSISPDARLFKLAISDPETRLAQYTSSLMVLFNEKRVKSVVFAENTGFGKCPSRLMEQADAHGVSFEWLSFAGNTARTVRQGKGYGEGEIIDHALRNSDLLKLAPHFFKLTGRVSIRNLDAMLRFMKADRNYLSRMSCRGSAVCDTRFFGVRADDYNIHLRSLYEQVDDARGVYIEHLFASEVRHMDSRCFPLYPLYTGLSGSTGSPYDIHPAKAALRHPAYALGLMSL